MLAPSFQSDFTKRMTEREIRIGDTSSFRYIGVQPPLSETAAGAVMKTLRLPDWMVAGMHDSYTQDPTGTTPESRYTEFGYDIGLAEETFGRPHVNRIAIVLACQVAKILERQGDSVHLDPDIVPTDFENPLFGEKADRVRKTRRMLSERRATMNGFIDTPVTRQKT